MNLLEVASNVVTAVSILLAARNSVHTWWTGIGGCALFGVLFFQHQLYADVVLQAFFVVTSTLGWWQWLHGNGGRKLPVSHAPARGLILNLVGGMVVAAAYGWMLRGYTNAFAPYLDSAILVFSVVAQFLLMRRRVESWAFWLLVNTIAVPVYASRGLYLTAALYAAYWVNAIIALRYWTHLTREAHA